MSTKKKSATHLDRSVIKLFVSLFLIATTTVAFKYVKSEPCDEVYFTHSASAYRVGELIKFNDETEGAQEWQWDFGDGSETVSQKSPLHIYTNKGSYEIKLLVNNSCKKSETVIIDKTRVVLDTTKFPKFSLPKTIQVGEVLRVVDETKNATSWEWRFGETASANATTKTAQYVYESPGLKTVALIVNGDLNHIQKKRINVLPLPETKEKIKKNKRLKRDKRLELNQAPKDMDTPVIEEEKPNISPFVTTGNLENKIKLVARGKINPQVFSEFFCGDTNPLVEVNGRNTTFLDFCEKISGMKIKVKSLNLIRRADSNCISSFKIEYKKSGLFKK